MIFALLFLALAWPVCAAASCDGLLSVHSSELAFSYVESTPDDAESYTREFARRYHERLAHALAVASKAFEYARSHAAGVPATVILLPYGQLAPADPGDSRAKAIAAHADSVGSVCTLWTIELARFRTEKSAIARAQEIATAQEDAANYVPRGDAVIYYESCAGTWEPGSFVVRGSGVAPWAVRRGLYLTRRDAERAAREWGPRAKVLRQRVGGALLEQALSEPIEGC